MCASFPQRLKAFRGHGVTHSTDCVFYWRQSLLDGVYSVPASLIRAARASTARFVGQRPGAEVAMASGSSHLAASQLRNLLCRQIPQADATRSQSQLLIFVGRLQVLALPSFV